MAPKRIPVPSGHTMALPPLGRGCGGCIAPKERFLWERDLIRVESRHGGTSCVVKSLASDHTLAATLDEFTAAIVEDRTPEVDVTDNLQTVAMAFGTVESATLGHRVSCASPKVAPWPSTTRSTKKVDSEFRQWRATKEGATG